MFEFLQEETISPRLLRELEAFRAENPLPEELRQRIPAPRFHYYGKEIWEQAAAALLCGKNLLLTGGKATGKNVLAENLAMVFGRPSWNVSFHVNVDAFPLATYAPFVGDIPFTVNPAVVSAYVTMMYGAFPDCFGPCSVTRSFIFPEYPITGDVHTPFLSAWSP